MHVRFKILSIYLILAVFMSVTWSAGAQRTTRRNLKSAPQTTTVTVADTVSGAQADSIVRFSGYEKTLRATRETIFITNKSERDITDIDFTVTYYDSSHRQLHRRRVESADIIPAGETRRLDFPSWDKQHSFYSTTGPRPRVPAIPYTVTVTEPRIVLSD